MKMKSLFFPLSCLLLVAVMGTNQLTQAQPPDIDFAQMMQSPLMQRTTEMSIQHAFRSFWDGRGTNLMAMGLLQDADLRAAWNVSDEQFQSISPMHLIRGMMENPEWQEMQGEMGAFMQSAGVQGNPFEMDFDEETMDRFVDIQGRIMALSMDFMSDAIGDVLTPEQQQLIGEAHLAAMGEMPIIAPGMFEVLGLTDDQRQHMEEIKNELEPEFERLVADYASGTMVVMRKLFEELDRDGGLDFNINPEDPDGMQERVMQEHIRAMQERMQAAMRRLMDEDPEFRRVSEAMQSQGVEFTTQFRIRMFDVLTDEQWDRLQDLIDNPPESARILLRLMREQRGEGGESEEASEQPGVWQPGPDSWRPGMPLPEQYRQQRQQRRFPSPSQAN